VPSLAIFEVILVPFRLALDEGYSVTLRRNIENVPLFSGTVRPEQIAKDPI